MDEGRRHSVDIPIKKTIVALKRVRSLRDPTTNSMSKFITASDDANWEVKACVRETLDLGSFNSNQVHKSHKICLENFMLETQHNVGSGHASRIINNRNTTSKRSSVVKIKASRSKRSVFVRHSCRDCCKRPLEKVAAPPSTKPMPEEVDSCSGTNVEVAETILNAKPAKKKNEYVSWKKTSSMIEEIGMSRVGSPSFSLSEIQTNLSSRSTYGFTNNDEIDVVDSNCSGCGISNCWSRTPKDKDPTLSPDIEAQELPLLSTQGGVEDHKVTSLVSDNSKSLCQKYRPRSFGDLVGLKVVAKSLMHAISRGKIAPLYLFHGPRGTGKTSTARIFAATLNCLSVKEHRPCGFCRECVFLFSGQSRDVKELYAATINHKDRIKTLLKGASRDPLTSQFKVYIVEECHFLRGEILSAILNNVEILSRHVFVMITSDSDKLPQSLLSQCQRYHFPKIKDDDMICRLENICIQEGFVFERDALVFLSSKANGSLRDAENTLDQLALLGKKITLSLTHELMGVVSDEELLDLLYLALSADTSNTVRKARELMWSRIDPMQLVSQLAKLIMDILSGGCHPEFSLAAEKFLGKYAHCQALDSISKSPIQTNFICYGCSELNCSGNHCNRAKLEAIWRRAIRILQSGSLKGILEKEGNLSSLHIREGQALATIEFYNPDHVTKAEKSWKLIASSLQNVLGCHVDLRINLLSTCEKKNSKVRKLSLTLLNCSGRRQELSESNITDENERQYLSRKESIDEIYPTDYGHKFSPQIKQLHANTMHDSSCFHAELVTGNNIEEKAQSNRREIPAQFVQTARISMTESNSSKARDEIPYISIEESEVPPSCFSKVLKLQRRLLSCNASHIICLKLRPHSKSDFYIPKKSAEKAHFLTYDSYDMTPSSNTKSAALNEDRV
ncbi:hypothetical protein AXF42_Ash006182 [Apostasia shenzhenica]|uniref:DNA-directed DNA polymerase n=1 Tax=Apostasia shenzhenica TaxID=1088818 RepID=A0A2I0B0I9_9ASPA|nr:hypothetical protein AXF42_Ash006182 [Apostasia shenzhenica]